jgi:hypothetical protein
MKIDLKLNAFREYDGKIQRFDWLLGVVMVSGWKKIKQTK